MREWKWRQCNSTLNITLPGWEQKGVRVAVSSRPGGGSLGDYSSLNLAFQVGDHADTVIKNRQLWATGLGVALTDMVCARQVHSANVVVVTECDRGRGVFDHASGLPDTDAMITNCPGVFLVTFYADCIPVLLFDQRKRVIGVAHAGWKGTMARIAALTVDRMGEKFSCEPADIQAFIGPGIGSCCYEVDRELGCRVKREFFGEDQLLHPAQAGKFYWDLPQTNRMILKQAGLLEEHIAACGLCTACNRDLFFSYRGSGGNTGRIGVLLGLERRW